MEDECLMDVDVSDLERNGSLLNEVETDHDRIEERIPRNSAETMEDVGERRTHNENNVASVSKNSERGQGCKRYNPHLVAKALGMSSEVKKPDNEGRRFYDCNICLEVAKEPILTCCGHLFCWPCFYQVSAVDSNSKKCPVCKGEVSDSTVIPIYGGGDGKRVFKTESGLMIPPRPEARRVESVGQQQATQGRSLSLVPVVEAIIRIRMSISAIDNQTHREGGRGMLNFNTETQVGQSDRLRIRQVPGVLSENAAFLSAALYNAERLVEDLRAAIHNRLPRNDTRSVTQPYTQFPVSTAYTNVTWLPITYLHSTDVTSVPRTRGSSDVNLPLAPSSSSNVNWPRISYFQSTDVATSIPRTRGSSDVNLPLAPPSSSNVNWQRISYFQSTDVATSVPRTRGSSDVNLPLAPSYPYNVTWPTITYLQSTDVATSVPRRFPSDVNLPLAPPSSSNVAWPHITYLQPTDVATSVPRTRGSGDVSLPLPPPPPYFPGRTLAPRNSYWDGREVRRRLN